MGRRLEIPHDVFSRPATQLGLEQEHNEFDAPLSALGWSPVAAEYATASGKEITLWQPGAPKPRLTLKGHEGTVLSVSYARDGKRLASASEDKTLRVWDVESGKLVAARSGHEETVTSLSWAPDHQRIATC